MLKRCRHSSQKTPLEDFTTEAFSGILKLEPEIKKKFTEEFPDLPEGLYCHEAQVKYDLPGDSNCIIDFEIKRDSKVCFIENKVDSHEGYRLLERYCKRLDMFSEDGKNTRLFYCTKNYDPKDFEGHDFRQFRWDEIAKFLRQFREIFFGSLLQYSIRRLGPLR